MKASLSVMVESHAFAARDLIGGDAALDFVNTTTGRDETPRDWLDDYSSLLSWAALAEALPKRQLSALAVLAKRSPGAAGKALARAKVLRESMFAVLSDSIAGKAPSGGALDVVRSAWLMGAAAHELRFRGGHLIRELIGDAADLDLIGSLMGYGLVERILPLPAERLRICHGTNCSWLFVDRSKAGRRRWCDMAVCGNTAKSRRFQARARS